MFMKKKLFKWIVFKKRNRYKLENRSIGMARHAPAPHKVFQVVQDEGLRVGSQRKVSLILMSCVGLAYTHLLKEKTGFSYETVGVLGKADTVYTLVNEERVVRLTEQFLQKNTKRIHEVLDALWKQFVISKNHIARLNPDHPWIMLESVLDAFPKGLASLSFANCFWRFVGNDESKKQQYEQLGKEISRQREQLATWYQEVEEKLVYLTDRLGERLSCPGLLVRYATRTELQELITTKKLSQRLRSEWEKRKHQYVYLRHQHQEEVVTDQQTIAKVEAYTLPKPKATTHINGTCAFPGNVTGPVWNSETALGAIPPGCILVTPMTHPKDTEHIKKCKAIVTDEGGVLSHVAISHVAILERELKKPCVMGTRLATRVLTTGQRVKVDAGNGIVKKL